MGKEVKTYVGYIGCPEKHLINMPLIMDVDILDENSFKFNGWHFLSDKLLPKMIGKGYWLEPYMIKFDGLEQAIEWKNSILKKRKERIVSELETINEFLNE
jgi:hypothetical protein